jgi:hypothetical protein
MAGKTGRKKVITTEEVVDDESIPAEKELDDDVIRALTEIEGSSEIRWQIHRVSQPDPGYCGECTTAELSLQYIADTYGPGRYQIKGIQQDGKYFKSRQVAVTKGPKKPDATPDLIAALKGGSADSSIQTMLIAMMQANTQIVTAALSKPDKPEKEFPWKEILIASPALLTAAKEFFSRKDESGEAMDKFLKTLTIVEKLRGDDKKDGSTWTDIIRDGVSNLPSLVASLTKSGGSTTPQPVAARVVGGTSESVPAAVDRQVTAADTPEAVEPTPELMSMQWLKSQLDTLVQKAAANRNASLYAELFVEEMPSYIPDELVIQLLSDAGWFDKLCQFDARVQPYRGWFENFTEAVLYKLQDDDEPKAPPSNTGASE